MSIDDPKDTPYTREQLGHIIDGIHMTGEPDDAMVAMFGGDRAAIIGMVNTVFEAAKNDLRAALHLPQKCPCGYASCMEPYSEGCGFIDAEAAMQQVLDLVPAEESDDVAVPPQA